MRSKFHWGHGILVFLIIFILLMITIVRFAMKQKINLVTPDYYSRELVYQEDIDKLENTQNLSEKVKVEITDKYVEVIFPNIDSTKSVSGTMQVYRPSDYDKDLNYSLDLQYPYKVIVPNDSLVNGLYDIIIDWKLDSTEYLQKERIIIKK